MIRSATLRRASIFPSNPSIVSRRSKLLGTTQLFHANEVCGSSSLSTYAQQHAEGTITKIPPPLNAPSSEYNGVAASAIEFDDDSDGGSAHDDEIMETVQQAFPPHEEERKRNEDNIRQQTAFILEEIPSGEFTPETWDRAMWLVDKWTKTSRMTHTPESVDQSFVLLDRLVMEQEVQLYHPLSCRRLDTVLLRKMVFNWNRCIRRFHSYSMEDQALLRFEYTPMELLARLEHYADRSPRLQLDTRTLNHLIDGASRCSKPSSSGMPNMISPRVATSFVESLFDRMDAQNKQSSSSSSSSPRSASQDPATPFRQSADHHAHRPDVAFHSSISNNYHPDGMPFADQYATGHDLTASQNHSQQTNLSQYHPKYVAIRRRNPPPYTTPDIATYTAMIILFSNNGLAGRAEAHLNKLYKKYMEHKSPRLKPDLSVFTGVLQALCRCDEDIQAAERAEDILHRMRELADCRLIPEVAPDELAYAVVLSAYAKRADIRDTMGGKRSRRRETAERCLQRARDLFARMQTLGFANTSAFNIMINALSKAGRPMEAEDMLKRMHEEYANGNERVQPGSIAYNTVLTAWARSGDSRCGDRAEEILVEFDQHVQARTVSDPPDRVTYNTALYCLAQAKQAERADALLEHMKQTQRANGVNISPDTVSYNSVMDAYAKTKNPRRAEEILEAMYKDFSEMKGKKNARVLIRPDVQTFTIVLNAWLNSGHPHAAERAEAILKTMHSINDAGVLDVAPTNPAYNIVLACWCKTQNAEAPHRALQLLDKMEELFNNGSATVRPDELAYDSVIRAFCNNSSPYRAEQVLERQHVQSLPAAQGGGGNLKAKPKPKHYHRILGAYSRSGHYDAAKRAEALFKLWQSRFESGVVEFPPDDVSVSLVCTAFGNATVHDPSAGQRVKQFLKFVNEKQPSSPSPGGTSSSRTGNAEALHSELRTSSQRAVLETFSKLKDAPSAHEHFLWMCDEYQKGEESLKPDLESLDRVLTLWRTSKDADALGKMSELLDKIKEMSTTNQIDWKASLQSYRILLNCLEDVRSMDAAMKAQLLLQELEDATTNCDNGSIADDMMKLEARDYIQIVRIWTKVDNEDTIMLADAAFQRMTQRYTPSAATYDLLIKAWARSGHQSATMRMSDLRAEKAIIHGSTNKSNRRK